MKYEVITLGRRKGFPERNNARYFIFPRKPKFLVGDIIPNTGDYIVEVIYIKKYENLSFG